MKFPTASSILVALSAVSALADTDATPTVSYPSAVTSSAVTDSPQLEIRQNNMANPNAALTAVAGAGVVTNYEINSQVGPSVGTQVAVVYTQTFANVPDQLPSAKPGTIGLGDLAKRNLDAVPALVEEARPIQTEYLMQPVVVQMVTKVATVPVRRTTKVVVVEMVTMSNGTGSLGNVTKFWSSGMAVAKTESGSGRPLFAATAQG